MKKITQAQLINLIVKRKKDRTWREFARELGTSSQYLNDVVSGRRDPGPAILLAMGLRKISYFVEIGGE